MLVEEFIVRCAILQLKAKYNHTKSINLFREDQNFDKLEAGELHQDSQNIFRRKFPLQFSQKYGIKKYKKIAYWIVVHIEKEFNNKRIKRGFKSENFKYCFVDLKYLVNLQEKQIIKFLKMLQKIKKQSSNNRQNEFNL